MARVYGYARPTASLPDTDGYVRQLEAAGAAAVFVEKNGLHARRAMRERRRLLDQIASGDTLILLSLDQLGTSFDDVLRCFELLVDRGVHVKVLDAGFETAGAFNAAYRNLLKLLSSARSALQSDSIKQNLAVARTERGKKAGKPAILRDDQWPDIRNRIEVASIATVAKELDVSRQTLWTYRRRMTAKEAERVAER